jgi:hypothetical protein
MDEEPPHALIDTTNAHPARVYDYWLGGKDNISQVVLAIPHSDPTEAVQASHGHYSKIALFVVRYQFGCLCPFYRSSVPDSDLTPLTGAVVLVS